MPGVRAASTVPKDLLSIQKSLDTFVNLATVNGVKQCLASEQCKLPVFISMMLPLLAEHIVVLDDTLDNLIRIAIIVTRLKNERNK